MYHTSGNVGVLFNLCKVQVDFDFVAHAGINVPHEAKEACKANSKSAYAYSFPLDGSRDCTAYDGDSAPVKSGYHQYVHVEETSQHLNVSGLVFNYTDSSAAHSLIVNNTCAGTTDAAKEQKLLLRKSEVPGGRGHIYLEYSSGSGCATFSLNVLTQFIEQYWYIWGAVFIVVGLAMALLGNAFVNVVIFFFTFAGSFMFLTWLIFFICYKAEANQSEGANWAILISCLVVSLLIAFFVIRIKRCAIAILGGVGGAFIGIMVTTMCMVGTGAAYYIIIAGCALGCAVLTYFVEDYVVMVVTAFVGSYMFIRGISFYAGGFPPETAIYEILKHGDITRAAFNKGFYGYLAGIAVLFVGTFIF